MKQIVSLFLSVVTILLIMVSGPVPAHAIEGALMKGKSLALFCASTKNEDQFACQSYIAGVIDYHNLVKSLGTAPSVDFCIPKEVTMSQIKQVVTRYMYVHTEHQDFIAAPGVGMALYTNYPCAKKRR